jgi:hypothetical protein
VLPLLRSLLLLLMGLRLQSREEPLLFFSLLEGASGI